MLKNLNPIRPRINSVVYGYDPSTAITVAGSVTRVTNHHVYFHTQDTDFTIRAGTDEVFESPDALKRALSI